MNAVEYGKQNQDVIVLLHGGGLSWWHYREAAERLAERFHVVLPILDGHAGSDRPFTTIEANAESLIQYVDKTFGGHVLLMGGASLGGQILAEILSQRSAICNYAVLESTLVLPMKLTAALIDPAFSMCYPLIQKRWFARWQFRSLHIKPSLFEDYYRDTCRITQEDMIAFLKANADFRVKQTLGSCKAKTLVAVGGREGEVMKRSAKQLAEKLPQAGLEVMKGLRHGEWSINHAGEYVKKLLDWMER